MGPRSSKMADRGSALIPAVALLMALVFLICLVVAIGPALLSFSSITEVHDWQCNVYILVPYIVYMLCEGISTTPAVTQAVVHVIYGVRSQQTMQARQGAPLSTAAQQNAHAEVNSLGGPSVHQDIDESCQSSSLLGRVTSQANYVAQRFVFLIVWQIMAFACYGGAVMAQLAIVVLWIKVGRPPAANTASPHLQQQRQHDLQLLKEARANARCVAAMTAMLNNLLMFIVSMFLVLVPLAALGRHWSAVVAFKAVGAAFTAISGATTLSRFLCACCLNKRASLHRCSTWLFYVCVNLYLIGSVLVSSYVLVCVFSRYGSTGQQVYLLSCLALHLSVLLLNPDLQARRMLTANWSTTKVLLVGCLTVSPGTGVCLDWPALLTAYGLAEQSNKLARQHTWCKRVLFSPANMVLFVLRLVGQGLFLLVMLYVPSKPPCQGFSPAFGQQIALSQDMQDVSTAGSAADQAIAPVTDVSMTRALFVGCQQCSLPLQFGMGQTMEYGSRTMWLIVAALAAGTVGAYITAWFVLNKYVVGSSLAQGSPTSTTASQTGSGPAQQALPADTNHSSAADDAEGSGKKWRHVSNWCQFVAVMVVVVVSGLAAIALEHPWLKLAGYLGLPLAMVVLQWVAVPWDVLHAAVGLGPDCALGTCTTCVHPQRLTA